VDVPVGDLMRNPVFHVQRQGDQSDFVELASGSNSAAHSEIIWAELAHKICLTVVLAQRATSNDRTMPCNPIAT
jgi:hypothetical protein